MTKKSKLPYWKRRMLRIAQMRDAKDQEYIRKMEKDYKRLSKRICKEIQVWMDRYADNEGITPDEAYQQLSKDEQLTWTMTLKEFRQKAIEGGYDQELNREYFKSRITRLEQLERQLYFELAEAANHQETAMRTYLKDTLNETYLRHIYEMTDRGAFSIAFDRYSTKALELAIMKPWKGSNFSRRVWGNHLNYLPDKLSKTMSVAVSQGWGIDRTVKEMMQGVDSSLKNRMTTLVQTESAHIAEVANDRAMEQTGVKKWEWLATLEIHTCARCGGLDGQEFDVDDENAPNCPDHPNCRCTRVPVIAGWQSATRWQRDPVTGKGSVEKHQTFEKWRKDKVTPEVERDLKIERARTTDKKQFDRYKSVLGSNSLPKKFADFQDLKYNKSEEWHQLKDNYFIKSRLKDGRWGSTINPEKQAPHMRSTSKKGKSYFEDDVDVQALFDKYAGTGKVELDRLGRRKNTEKVYLNYEVGVEGSTGKKVSGFKIHHSKNRTHIVPMRKE